MHLNPLTLSLASRAIYAGPAALPQVTLPPPVAVSDQIATFGALTASGRTGFRPIAENGEEVMLAPGTTPTLVSGSLGAYTAQISTGTASQEGGRLYFTGAAGAPHGAVLRCALATGGTVDLTIDTVPNAYTIGSPAEFTVNSDAFFKISRANFAGKTFIVRARDGNANYGLVNANWTDRFAQATQTVYIRGEKPQIRPLLGNGGVFGNSGLAPHGYAEFEHLAWYSDVGFEDKLTANLTGGSAQTLFTTSAESTDIVVRNCTFSTNCPIARLTSGAPTIQIFSADLNGEKITFENNIVYRLVNGVRVGCSNSSIQYNDISYHFVDCLHITTSRAVTNTVVSNNVFHDCIGDNGYHPDMLQIYGPFGSTNSFSGITIEGNIYYPGYEGVRTPAWDKNKNGGGYNRETTYQIGNRVLTNADHNKMIIVDAAAMPSEITIPPLSEAGSVNATPDFMIQAKFAPTAGIIIKASPGDKLWDLPNQVEVDSFTLTYPWESYVVWLQTSPRRWVLERKVASYQGVFGQDIPTTEGEVGGFTVSHNLLYLNAKPVADGDKDGAGWNVLNNSGLAVWPDLGPLYNPSRSNRTIDTAKTNASVAGGNIAASYGSNGPTFPGAAYLPTAGTISTANVTASELDLNNEWTHVAGAFSPPDPLIRRFCPVTADEAIAYARPKAGGLLPTGMGCGLSQDPANDHWNFGQHPNEPLGKRRNTPWEVVRLAISVIPSGADISWLPPSYLKDGPITGYECRYSINNGAWITPTLTDLSVSVRDLHQGDVVRVQVRASNANGAGVWTPVISKTIAEDLPDATPTLTPLSDNTSAFRPTTVSNQVQSGTVNVSGGKPVLVCVGMRSQNNNSVVTATATIGASGRAFGTGTPLRLVASESTDVLSVHTFIFVVEGLSAAANQTVQVTFVNTSGAAYNANGLTFQVYEINGGKLGDIAGVSGATRSISTANSPLTLTTQAYNSLIVGATTITSSQAIGVSGYDSLVSPPGQMSPNAPTSTVMAIRGTAASGAYTQSFTLATATQLSHCAVEIKAAVA